MGIDLHRRRSVVVVLNADGDRVSWSRIDNTPVALAQELAAAGPGAEVAMEATWGWYWATPHRSLLQPLRNRHDEQYFRPAIVKLRGEVGPLAGGRIGSGLESFDGGDPVDGLVKRRDAPDSGGLGACDEVGLGEVESVDLVDLDRAEQEGGIDGDD